MEKLNDQIRAGEVDDQRIMICSLDVSALYPSIDTKLASKIVRDEIRESPMKFEGVDWRWALVYLALTMTNGQKVDAGIQGLIPRRLVKKNDPPTIKTWEVDTKRERWWYPKPPGFLTQDDKKIIMACVAEQMVLITFTSHCYMWEGEIYHQQGGCPMGRDASSPISRIVMGKWLEKVREVELRTKEMNEINPVQYEALDIKLAKKYVDDVLASLYRMKLGTHWVKEKGLLI